MSKKSDKKKKSNKERLLRELREAVLELKQIEEGKLKGRKIEELLKEL